MPRAAPLVLLLAVLAAPAALAAQDTTHAPAPAPAKDPARIKRNPDVISREEIDAAGEAQTAWDIVKRLRPTWFNVHGGSITLAVPDVQVYLNELRQGDTQTLRDIPRSGIREIRHLRGPDATQRFGMGHDNGAILVFIK
jgi:hypothetical protein